MSTPSCSVRRQIVTAITLPCLLALLLLLSLSSCKEESTTTQPSDNSSDLYDNMPTGNKNYTLRIIAFEPNPKGTDDLAENWTLRNFSKSKTLTLADYKIVDQETGVSIEWQLNGSLAPGDTIRIVSDKTAQFLNSGDEILLYASDGTLIQTLGYTEAKEGDIIKP